MQTQQLQEVMSRSRRACHRHTRYKHRCGTLVGYKLGNVRKYAAKVVTAERVMFDDNLNNTNTINTPFERVRSLDRTRIDEAYGMPRMMQTHHALVDSKERDRAGTHEKGSEGQRISYNTDSGSRHIGVVSILHRFYRAQVMYAKLIILREARNDSVTHMCDRTRVSSNATQQQSSKQEV